MYRMIVEQSQLSLHLGLFQLGLQVTQVHVFVSEPLGPTQPDPVNDGGVIQLIRQHRVVWAQQHLIE